MSGLLHDAGLVATAFRSGIQLTPESHFTDPYEPGTILKSAPAVSAGILGDVANC